MGDLGTSHTGRDDNEKRRGRDGQRSIKAVNLRLVLTTWPEGHNLTLG